MHEEQHAVESHLSSIQVDCKSREADSGTAPGGRAAVCLGCGTHREHTGTSRSHSSYV